MPQNFSPPFSWMSLSSRKNALFLLGFLTLFLTIVLHILDQPLQNVSAPNGIVSFELAKDFSQSQKILASWNPAARLYAALSLGIDYLYLAAYSFFLSLSCFSIAQKFSDGANRFFRTGILIAWLQLTAAVFDALENYVLIRLLLGSQQELFSRLAYYFACVKFLLIISGILYILTGLIRLLISKIRFSN